MSQRRKKISKEDEEEVINHMTKSQELNLNTVSINFKCKTENQKKFINQIKEKIIVIGTGYAGTGKTFAAIAEALRLLKSEPQYKKIILVKSVTVLKGEEVGFLKGTLDEKLLPGSQSFLSTCFKIIGKGLTEKLIEQEVIEIRPLTYLRGVTLDGSLVIVDEGQNISFDNMKTVLTRIGENSKMIIIGDQHQIDLKNKKDSCLSWLTERFEKDSRFGVTLFLKTDQVRNPIITVIEDMFDELP